MGIVRTYIPTLLALSRRLSRYIDRYDETIIENLPEPRKAAFKTFRIALDAWIDANSGYVS